MTFTAEDTNSAGQLFATFKVNASSIHYPLGVIWWGADSASIQSTDTAAPFPVRLYGNSDSSNPVFVVNSSVTPMRIVGESGSTTITVTNDSVVTVTGLVAPVASSRGESSTTPLFVAASSTNPMRIVGESGSTSITVTGTLATSTNVTVTNIAANDTVISATITAASNDSTSPLFINNSTSNPMATTYVGTQGVGLQGLSALAGGLTPIVLQLSSLMQSPMTAVGRLYGYSVSNPDTVDNAWMLIYPDDSAGITLGTSSASISVMVPFGGGANISIPQGINMSSGMTVTSALTGNSTAHDTPAASLTATLWYEPST